MIACGSVKLVSHVTQNFEETGYNTNLLKILFIRNARVKLGDYSNSATGQEEEQTKVLVDFVFDDQITFAVDTQVFSLFLYIVHLFI